MFLVFEDSFVSMISGGYFEWAQGDVRNVVHGKRPITADTALRLGRYLGTSPELWIGLQGESDLRAAHRKVGPKIERRIQKHIA